MSTPFKRLLCVLLGCSLASPLSSPVAAQEGNYIEVDDEVSDALMSEEAVTWSEYWDDDVALDPDDLESRDEGDDEDPSDLDPETITPISLPGDQEASAVTPQALSLPSAEGSVEGMGESFSPILSSGTATYSVPIAIPAGRAGVQPTFAISYSSTGGNSMVGFGWGFEAPYIARQTDRGLPRYHDSARWTGDEDRFFYNGGQELVPVSDSSVASLDLDAGVPAEYAGWQQYRARVEGAFMRFFRAPDHRRWAVQSPDGSLMEFGELPASGLPSDFGSSASALQTEDGAGRGRIFRWFLTRMSDSHGSTVYYRYDESSGDGSRYLRDVHYTSPMSCSAGESSPSTRRTCTAPLSNYGRRVRFVYTARPDVFSSYTAGWRVDESLRLARIHVSSAEGAAGARYMVRRYHFSYYPESTSFHSLLQRVQVEARPDADDMSAGVRVGVPTAVSESAMDAGSGMLGPTLPPLTFEYSEGRFTSDEASGFGGIYGTSIHAPASPPHSIDEGRADLFDVNSDGLPDILVTDPARYRTAGGNPASGVFFNGFSGSSAAPATPGTFSGAVSVVVPSSLSSTMNLANLNVVPMDIDGDGRSDLLHMPRVANYGYFMPTRDADGTLANVSPRDQGWRFSYVPVTLPTGVTDPRIDLGRDGAHIRVLDVNNDHLVDVVRTTGTVMQTWLNLGWLPDGEGRFGSATFAGGGSLGAGTWALSTEPVESCLLQSGLPVDFEDPETRLADMNGDGIQDIVQVQRGRVRYWPGRGEGSWGIGPQACPRGAGANRYIEMTTAPAELNVDLDGVYIQDINEDGTADVIQIRYDAIDVWFNRAGRGFTNRVIARGTPYRPAFLAGRIRFADMDGSGTTDVLYGNANDYEWVDLMGGVRPRMLTRVDNGLGALTTLEYGSSAEEYLRDLTEAATTCRTAGACRDRFTWSHVDIACDERIEDLTRECIHRSGGSPLVVQVVTAVETTDRLASLGRESTVSRTEYRFHDAYYEGFEQEFRGFGAADAVSLTTGVSDMHPSGTTRSYFYQGRRPNAISTDRLADNPYESLKARVYQTESFEVDTPGTISRTLSTGITAYTVRHLVTGLDGRRVSFAFAHASSELRYDTSLSGGGGDELGTLDAVRFEQVGDGSIPTEGTTGSELHVVTRWGGAIVLASEVTQMDNQGHALRSIAYGRILTDEAIVGVAEVSRLGTSGTWMFRPGASWTEGNDGPSVRFGETYRTYDPLTGDLIYTESSANLPTSFPTGYDFGTLVQANQIIQASSTFDAWGNALTSCGGSDLREGPASACLRYGQVDYDTVYGQFPLTERIATAAASAYLTTTGTWDHGLGVLRTVTDPNGNATSVGYDGFGRVTFVRPPAVAGCTSDVPVQRFVYQLTTNPSASPISVVIAYQENSCDNIGVSTIETRSYVDGLGRARASLTTAEESGSWIQSGITLLNGRGTVRRAFQPERVSFGMAPSPSQALIIPGTPYEDTRTDAFDRPWIRTPPYDGSTPANYTTTYHALTRDECDPLDNGSAEPFTHTCTTVRLDGHGRVVDQVLRNRQLGVAQPMEYYRLFTTYRADGAVTAIQRCETTDDGGTTVVGNHTVSRTFTYDTAGRRIGTTDPDSDYIVTGGWNNRNRTWRYLFNRVGDLVAVRDSTQCGQNFYYDYAARLIAEDYVGCNNNSYREYSNQHLPAGFIGLERTTSTTVHVEVLYHYDAAPSWASGHAEVGASEYLGRLAGVSDRAQHSVMAYDDRGLVTWTARQVTVLPDFMPTWTSSGVGRPVLSTYIAYHYRTYDTAHDYERTASYDHGGRPTDMTLPIDPDFSGTAPLVGGRLGYNQRGLPNLIELVRDDDPSSALNSPAIQEIIAGLDYTRDGLVERVEYGDVLDASGSPRDATVTEMTYDVRRRPMTVLTTREATGTGTMVDPRPLAAVETPFSQALTWDVADNLVAIADMRDPMEWPDGYRPQSTSVAHDALYRVVLAEYSYETDSGTSATDDASDWRDEAALSRPNDPMGARTAPMLGALPDSRPSEMSWEYDWLGNAVQWDDDADQFYERSLGDIWNGLDIAGTPGRPGAIYIANNFHAPDPSGSRGGWLRVDYTVNGGVSGLSVYSECHDQAPNTCSDNPTYGNNLSSRLNWLYFSCECQQVQHYVFRWDEVNRISEAYRFDGAADAGPWTMAVQQRYLYDSSNERIVKSVVDPDSMASTPEAVALYVYPGDFERRGLVVNTAGTSYEALSGAETQYVVGGARYVFRDAAHDGDGIDRDQRITIGLSDLIQSTSATLDLVTGELVETSNYYANGARESYRGSAAGDRVAPEPMGFTGKEADEEVGLTYFGQRYLMAHLGRWASPDPLQTHAVGGGEALNGYHYVAGNVLQARDPVGLEKADEAKQSGGARAAPSSHVLYVRVSDGSDSAQGDDEVRALRRAGARVDDMRFDGDSTLRSGSTTYDFARASTLTRFASDHGLSADTVAAINSANVEVQDDLARLALYLAEHGEGSPTRVVLSGHHVAVPAGSGGRMGGGRFLFGDLPDSRVAGVIAASSAAGSIRHLHLAACNSGWQRNMDMWRSALPNATIWSYRSRSPTLGGATDHLSAWARWSASGRRPTRATIGLPSGSDFTDRVTIMRGGSRRIDTGAPYRLRGDDPTHPTRGDDTAPYVEHGADREMGASR